MFIRNGQRFDTTAGHTIDDVQYPPEWFADPERRADLGITEVQDDAEILAERAATAAAEARNLAKTERQRLVDSIKVMVSRTRTVESVVDGVVVSTEDVTTHKLFDGDETSQNRMARAIVAMQAAGGVREINWTLASNENVPVTVDELVEALVRAGGEQARLWPLQT